MNQDVKITVLEGASKWESMIETITGFSNNNVLYFTEIETGHRHNFPISGMANGLMTTTNNKIGIELFDITAQ